MGSFQTLLTLSVSLMTIFLFGTAGEILTEKSGHLNLGTPGIMALGGLGGILGCSIYMNNIPNPSSPSPFLVVAIGIIFALIFGAFGGLIFSFFTVTLKCNQNVVGLILTTFGVAISTFFFTSSTYFDSSRLVIAATYFKSIGFPGNTETLPFVVDVFFSHGFLTYLGIVLCIVLGFVIRRTKLGLTIRSVGENPAAADAMGINVNRVRYLTTIAGSMITSLAGLFIVMVVQEGAGLSNVGSVMETFGWLAVALVIFSMWKPGLTILGGFIFSLLYELPVVINTEGGAALKYVLNMLPYIMTIGVLIVTSIMKFKSSKAPAALGTSYFREDR